MNLRLIATYLFVIISFAAGAQAETPADSTKLVNDDGKLVFEKVEMEASFSGGEMAWRKFLEKNLNANTPVDRGAPMGVYTIIVQFVVDKNGNVSDVKALTNFGYGMEEEVVRVIKKGPIWTPAIQDGRNVKAYRNQPVTFAVIGDGIEINSKDPFVLYTGTDNPVTIKVDKVKDESLEVTISPGTIVPMGDGQYKVRVNKPGKAIITVYNARKKNKELGSAYFTIKSKQ